MVKQKENRNPLEDIETVEECFIITPIGALGSETFTKAMGLIDAVIDPVLADLGMKAMPANRMQDLGSINKQLIKRVIEDRLVIANLTGLNPNVMYELAIRHGARKPVIIMAENGTRLPFDITDQRTIFYSDTLSGVEVAKDELKKKIEFALADENPDNPIYAYLENAKLFREIGDADPNKILLARLNSIEEKLSSSSDESKYRQRSIDYFRDKKSGTARYSVSGSFSDMSEDSEELSVAIRKMFSVVGTVTPIEGGIAHLAHGGFMFKIARVQTEVLNVLISTLNKAFPNIQDLRFELLD